MRRSAPARCCSPRAPVEAGLVGLVGLAVDGARRLGHRFRGSLRLDSAGGDQQPGDERRGRGAPRQRAQATAVAPDQVALSASGS